MKNIFVGLIFLVFSSSCRLIDRDNIGTMMKLNAFYFDKSIKFGVAEITKSRSLSIAYSDSVEFIAPNAGYSLYKITSGFALMLCVVGSDYNLYAYDILNRQMRIYIVPMFAEYIDFAYSPNGNKLAVYSPFAKEGRFVYYMEVVDGENKFVLKQKVGAMNASLDGMFFDASNKLNVLAFDEAFGLFELDDKTGVVLRKFNIDKNKWANVYVLSESLIAMSNGSTDEEWGIYSLVDRKYLYEFQGKFPGRFAKDNGVVLYGNNLVMNRSGHPPGPSLMLIYDLQTGKSTWKTASKFMAIGGNAGSGSVNMKGESP